MTGAVRVLFKMEPRLLSCRMVELHVDALAGDLTARHNEGADGVCCVALSGRAKRIGQLWRRLRREAARRSSASCRRSAASRTAGSGSASPSRTRSFAMMTASRLEPARFLELLTLHRRAIDCSGEWQASATTRGTDSPSSMISASEQAPGQRITSEG